MYEQVQVALRLAEINSTIKKRVRQVKNYGAQIGRRVVIDFRLHWNVKFGIFISCLYFIW